MQYARVTILSFAYVRLVFMTKSVGGISGACARNSLRIGPELKISLRCSSLPGAAARCPDAFG